MIFFAHLSFPAGISNWDGGMLRTMNKHLTKAKCYVYECGIVPYIEAWEWQRQLQGDRIHNPDLADALILLEHPSVYTLGQGATTDFLRFDPNSSEFAVHRIERGGEVTYHCPGQIVAYPILNLRRHQQDLHWYLRQLELVIIQVLQSYGLEAKRIPGLTGVWVEQRKVAAIGIKVSRWVTMHGFALNVCPDMAGFERIIPCGIPDKPVASLAQWLPQISLDEVRSRLLKSFADVFHLEIVIAGRSRGQESG